MVLTLEFIKEKQKELNELINFYSFSQKKYGKSVTNEELEEIKKQQEKLDEMIKTFEQEQEKEEELSTVWVPKNAEKYFSICENGIALCNQWDGVGYDKNSLKINNVFKTEEEAENHIEWLKILYELRTLGGDYWNNIKEKTSDCYVFGYQTTSREITTYKTYGHQEHSLPIYFDTKEKVKNAIETIGEDRLKKYWFRVEE